MPVILGCTLILLFLIHYESKKNVKSKSEMLQEFFKRELEANTTRKKDISGLPYQTIDLSKLPDISNIPDEDGEIAAILEALRPLDGAQILNLSGISNTDLKLSYGAANFAFLSECDARFTSFSRKLYELGTRLYEAGEEEKAIEVLEYAIKTGSDVGSTYRLLGSLYAKTQNRDALSSLQKKAEELPDTIRDYVCDFLNDLC